MFPQWKYIPGMIMTEGTGRKRSDKQIIQFVHYLKEILAMVSAPPPEEMIQVRNLLFGSQSREKYDRTTFQRMGMILYQKRNPTMGEVSQALSVPLSTATRMANWWVDNGYAQRLPDLDDRRIVRLTLTDSGMQFLDALEKHMEETVERVLGCLTLDEKGILVTLSAKVATSLKELDS